MNWLQGILYGLVSGLTEFLPVSSRAHQRMMQYLFGAEGNDPLLSFVIHLSVLLALYFASRNYLLQVSREQALRRRNKRKAPLSSYHALSDLRVVRAATLPMLISILVIRYIFDQEPAIPYVALVLAINGFLLFLPQRLMQGNKGPNQMSKFDSTLMGVAYGFSSLVGISGLGAVVSVAQSNGADRRKALSWALILSIPALLLLCGIDLFSLFSASGTVRLLPGFLCYVCAGIGAFATAYGGIVLLKRIFLHDKFTFFSFYCWGAALLLFLLYLTVA